MFTLRCTKKLLARLHEAPVTEDVEPTTRLGDWYANLLFRPGGQVVLFVNERSLLPVLVPSIPGSTLVTRFQKATADVLLALGVPAAAVTAELREMGDARIGRTESRQVLGSMNEFAYLMDAFREDPVPLTEAAAKLAKVPCSAIDWRHPTDVVLEILSRPRS